MRTDVDQLSLSYLIQAANQGDKLSMRLLANAYADGAYGAPQDKTQAAEWAARAESIPESSKISLKFAQEPWEQIPTTHIEATVAVGLLLIVVGLIALRSKPRKQRA